MSEGSYKSKKNKSLMIVLIVILSVILVLLLALVAYLEMNPQEKPIADPSVMGNETTSNLGGDTSVSGESEGTDSVEGSDTTGLSDQTGPQQTTEPDENTNGTTVATQPGQEDDPRATVDVVQRGAGEYEKWLSAAVIVGVSVEYPDFEFGAIYTPSATTLDEKFTSEGVYILFTNNGTQMAIHAVALEKERTAAGTVDISSENAGFATFDIVEPASVDVNSMEQIRLEELNDYIAQSLLISLYTH